MRSRTLFVFLTIAIIIFSSVLLAFLAYSHIGKLLEPGLKVYFFDVDQGDAILIRTPDHKDILVDCGHYDYAEDLIYFLKSLKVREIHAFIATHPDPDHIGAVPDLFAEFNVLVVYHSGFVKTTQTYYDFIDSLQEEGCAVYDRDDFGPGEILPISSKVRFKVLSVDPLAQDSNDASIVLKVSYGNFDMILEGDASWKKESYMIHHYGNELDIEVLKVSHHGSISASSYEWLEATTPDVAVICVGPNDYGLPNPIILDRLQRNCNSVLITDEEGCIMISSDGNNYEICSINL